MRSNGSLTVAPTEFWDAVDTDLTWPQATELVPRIITGDSLAVLSAMPSDYVQMCVTSPPYWSLRNYHIAGQIGLEATVDGFIESLVAVFEEVRRVLRPDGCLWLNIGDSYTSGGRTWRAPDKKNAGRAMSTRPETPEGLKPKDLIGVPWRLAFALQRAGWYLRADCIWNKPNCQPESVKDRPTRCHEYVFFLTKSERYYYDHQAVRGQNDRNLRTVWDINTLAVKNAHFATFPPALVEPCVQLTTRPGDIVLDPFFGSGTTGLVAGQHGRRSVGIELNPQYVAIARNRLATPPTLVTLPNGSANGHYAVRELVQYALLSGDD